MRDGILIVGESLTVHPLSSLSYGRRESSASQSLLPVPEVDDHPGAGVSSIYHVPPKERLTVKVRTPQPQDESNLDDN